MLPNGKVLLIVNPTSQSGRGVVVSKQAAECLRRVLGADRLDVKLTEYAGHATLIARDIPDEYSVVVALGGDGVIHEVVNGLMRRPAEKRPVLGIIPVGSGNDYARTLGIPSDIEQACNAIVAGNITIADVGKVNEHYFMETLSFGLDAAVAADTVERRKKTKRTGFILYLESGINQLFHNLRSYKYAATFKNATGYDESRGHTPMLLQDGTAVTQSSESFMFAVQVGPTYGGGFHICPDAKIDDGLFDICIAHPPLNIPIAAAALLSAKDGKHAGFKQVEFLRADGLDVEFDGDIAAQVDGESLSADSYHVTICPAALEVIAGE